MSEKRSEPSTSFMQQMQTERPSGDNDGDGVSRQFKIGSPNKIYKNLIICGEIDFHCLLCEVTMNNDADVEKHIQCENHRKLVDDALYLPEFTTDRILKVGDNFYCEICNLLMTTSIYTASHVKEDNHIAKKRAPTEDLPLKSVNIVREDKTIKILDTFIISEIEWNGIIDKHCLLCDDDLEDGVKHMRKPNHIRNLIRSRIVFLKGDFFYRMIKGSKFYCFICKSTYSKSDLDTHWSSEDHNYNQQTTSRAIPNYGGASTSKQGSSSQPSSSEEFKPNMNKLFRLTEKLKNLNISTQQKMHKKDNTFQLHDNDSEDDAFSDQDCEQNQEIAGYQDHQKIHIDLATFTEENYISLLNGKEVGHCNICDTYLDADMKNVRKHVEGFVHGANLWKLNQNAESTTNISSEYTTVPLKSYLRNIHFDERFDGFWINRNLSVDKHIFTLINFIDDDDGEFRNIKCYLCTESFPHDQDIEHCKTRRHRKLLFESKVITSLEDEFIREVHQNMYHCGFCNEVFPTWKDIKAHLKTFFHLDHKEQQRQAADYAEKVFWWVNEDINTASKDILEMRSTGDKLI